MKFTIGNYQISKNVIFYFKRSNYKLTVKNVSSNTKIYKTKHTYGP